MVSLRRSADRAVTRCAVPSLPPPAGTNSAGVHEVRYKSAGSGGLGGVW